MIRGLRSATLWGAAAVTTGAALAAALVAHAQGLAQSPARIAEVVTVSATVLVGALILTARPRHRIGRIMLTGGALWGCASPVVEVCVAALAEQPDRPAVVATAVVALAVRGAGWVLLITALALVFPDGHLPGRRWRWAAGLTIAAVAAVFVGGLFQPQPLDVRIEQLANPLAPPAPLATVAEAAFLLGFALSLVCAVVGLVAVGVRWRRGDPLLREQIGWFVLACLLVPVVMAVSLVDISEALPYGLAVVALPVSIGFAVLQRRLYDIEQLINRTLLFVLLSASVVGVYVLAVAGLGAMIGIRDDWGQGLIGAAAVAAAAEPLRRILQRAVNRLVYGDWEDPHDVGQRLGVRLADAAAPESALDAALAELAGALRLRWAAIDGPGGRVAEVGPLPSTVDEVATPLTHQGESVGMLRTVAGRRLRRRDRALLEVVARQIAPVVQARHLADELRHSRDRLAAAQLTERRRLRRDLHDGLGPTLAALTFKVDTARNVLAADEQAQAILLEIRDRLSDTVADVRRVVDGLRPPYLDELGLPGALSRLVADLPGPTTFRLALPEDPVVVAVAEPAQVAVYRIVQEALTNVVRHARATSCDVTVTAAPRTVELTIRDDGVGLTSNGGGHGLSTMRERVDELGGTLTVTAEPGTGTVVTVVLPR